MSVEVESFLLPNLKIKSITALEFTKFPSSSYMLYFTMTSIVYVYYEGLLMKSRNLSFLWFFLRISFYGKFGLKIYTHRLPLCVPSPFTLHCLRIPVPFTVRRPESEMPLRYLIDLPYEKCEKQAKSHPL